MCAAQENCHVLEVVDEIWSTVQVFYMGGPHKHWIFFIIF